MKIIILIVIVVAIVAGVAIYTQKDDSALPVNTDAGSATGSLDSVNPVKEFTVNGSNFKYDIPEMRVRNGDTVKINFNNIEGFHDLVIDEFDVATAQLEAGKSETVQFIADKTGMFEYYCSVGTHRQMGMKGSLIVEQ